MQKRLGNISNLKHYQKGHVPVGKGKKLVLKPQTILKRAMKKAISETMMKVASQIIDEDGSTFADKICQKVANEALKTNPNKNRDYMFLKLFMEYTQEKPISKQEISGLDGEPLNVLPTIKVNGEKLDINIGGPVHDRDSDDS